MRQIAAAVTRTCSDKATYELLRQAVQQVLNVLPEPSKHADKVPSYAEELRRVGTSLCCTIDDLLSKEEEKEAEAEGETRQEAVGDSTYNDDDDDKKESNLDTDVCADLDAVGDGVAARELSTWYGALRPRAPAHVPITDVVLMQRGDELPPNDANGAWHKVARTVGGRNGDLNRGAGGDYVYIAFRRGNDRPPITGISLVMHGLGDKRPQGSALLLKTVSGAVADVNAGTKG
ncbi:MAG: hypothetical protein MHM6MM_008974, partial [Cercozoa sp. M6MM]